MAKNQDKKFNNSFHLRVYDSELLKSMYELVETDKYDSMNELLNCALGIGIEKIYLEFGKRKLFSTARETPEQSDVKKIDKIDAKIEKLRLLQEDMFILMNSIEALACSIYNVHRAEANGETISVELMDSGYLNNLPQAFRYIKDKLIERFNRKQNKSED